jgi:Protein of unknown function, DUF547
MRLAIVIVLLVACVAVPSTRGRQTDGAPLGNFEQVLELYVRDGYVYYRALKAERARLDAYVASLANVSLESSSREEQIAFWLNTYNALVLRTVIDHFPVVVRTTAYPQRSIRQIPGAFERTQHRAAGRMVTLDQIEQTILTGFQDPRLFLALGRGAVGSGRLRNEVFSAGALERQLSEVAAECINRAQCLEIDRGGNQMSISSIFSWRADSFVAAYGNSAPAPFSSRSPIERAVLAFVAPRLVAAEREFLAGNQFKVVFKPFDWTLNDLAGRAH